MDVVVAPVDQTYVTPPLAVKTDDVPVQNELLPLITGTGNGFTFTVFVFVAKQPLISVTVTV